MCHLRMSFYTNALKATLLYAHSDWTTGGVRIDWPKAQCFNVSQKSDLPIRNEDPCIVYTEILHSGCIWRAEYRAPNTGCIAPGES